MVAGECSIIAGVIVTCILAVLSGLCLVLALVFFVYARRKLEQTEFIEKSARCKKRRREKAAPAAGVVNAGYMGDELNMQEAGSADQFDGNLYKNGIHGYVVCKEFIPSGHEKWSKGLVQDKLVYRLMAGDVNFEVRPDENSKSSFYLAFSGVKESSSNGALLSSASKLLKSGDRIHALMLNCSALAQNGQLDETTAQLLLKIITLVDHQPVAFVDVVSSGPHERLVDGGEACVGNVTEKETEAVQNAGQDDLAINEEAPKEEEHVIEPNNEEASSGACSDGASSPPKSKPGGGSFIARSRGHSRRSHNSASPDQAFQSMESNTSEQRQEDVAITVDAINTCLRMEAEQESSSGVVTDAIELTAQFPGFQQPSLPLPGPDLLQSPGDDVIVIETSSSSSSSSSLSNSDDEIGHKVVDNYHLNGSPQQNTELGAYLASL